MSQSITVNTKLIDSLTQIILSLNDEERSLLSAKVQNPHLSEAELQTRLDELKREIAIGWEQLERGEYTEYDDTTLPILLESIKSRGRQRRAEERSGL
jgi:sugar diacid utilization regulator